MCRTHTTPVLWMALWMKNAVASIFSVALEHASSLVEKK